MHCKSNSPELWAGIECSVTRIGNHYVDQIALSGHAERLDDLEKLASLGVSVLRYPVIWEHTQSSERDRRFDWAEERLNRLRSLGLRPIVGLLHHGSGPRHTNLLDPGFPGEFADYAAACAERFPWVSDFTPINEPLTTARFSALYGHWYPHARDDRSFVTALVNQALAIARAMKAIRMVSSEARLIQTEDIAHTWSTPELAEQAAFDNERRWLTFDLLCGRVTPEHSLYAYLLSSGASPAALEWLFSNPCPPDVLGLNYYLTSERYLDHRLDLFPPESHGTNGRQRYADVEAVRACDLAGPERLLCAAWARYGLPLAITEVHLHCTREEQLRWFCEVWNATVRARRQGVDARAVTLWAAFGSYDWDSLLTEPRGHYEPGAFDVRGGAPRPTALVSVAREIATSGVASHPLVSSPGWWRRPERILYQTGKDVHHERRQERAPSLLVTGASGTLGRAFARICERRGLPYKLTSRTELDITDEAQVAAILERLQPWAVVNTAGYVKVDLAEAEQQLCLRENTEGADVMARVCRKRGLPLLGFSSDLVFDGTKSAPYIESDAPRPLCIYGLSKLMAEAATFEAHPRALIVRTAAFFSPWDEYNFVARARASFGNGATVHAYSEVTVSPTYVPDLVDAALDLLIDGERGIWHLVNRGELSWYELAHRTAALGGFDTSLVVSAPAPAYLPSFTALTSERALFLPPLEQALESYFREAQAPVTSRRAHVRNRSVRVG